MGKKYPASIPCLMQELVEAAARKNAQDIDREIWKTISEGNKIEDLYIGVDFANGIETQCLMKVINPGTEEEKYEVVKIIHTEMINKITNET